MDSDVWSHQKALFIGKTSSDFVGMGLNFKKLFVSA